MVWHAFQLNPHDYLSDCLRHKLTHVWRGGMPWQIIDSLIDTDTGEYRVSEADQRSFEYFVGRFSGINTVWDVFTADHKKSLDCPQCRYEVKTRPGQLRVPWTTAGRHFTSAEEWLRRSEKQPPRSVGDQKRDAMTVDKAAASGTGYADAGFQATCPRARCNVTHGLLRATSFLLDAVTWRSSVLAESEVRWEELAAGVPMKGKLRNSMCCFWRQVQSERHNVSCKTFHRILYLHSWTLAADVLSQVLSSTMTGYHLGTIASRECSAKGAPSQIS